MAEERGWCPYCGQHMEPGGHCTMVRWPAQGDEGPRERIRWGDETHLQMRARLASLRGEARPFTNPLPLDAPEADEWLRVCALGPYFDRRDCPDCDVRAGSPHHEGCQKEECPICHLQAITCPCALPEHIGDS